MTNDLTRGTGSAWGIAAGVTAVNALTSAGFSVAGLLAPLPAGQEGAHVFAMYAAARSLPLAVGVLWVIAARSVRGLWALAWVMAAVQACDALIGIVQGDASKTIGPAVLALATAGAALWMRRQPPPATIS